MGRAVSMGRVPGRDSSVVEFDSEIELSSSVAEFDVGVSMA